MSLEDKHLEELRAHCHGGVAEGRHQAARESDGSEHAARRVVDIVHEESLI